MQKRKRLINYYLKHRWFVVSLSAMFAVMLIYLSTATANVPLMDYWRYINMFVPKMYTGGVTFWDLWQNDGVHRSPLQFLYFLLNVNYFHLNAQIEIYAGAAVLAIVCILVYREFIRTLGNVQQFARGLYSIGIVLIIYNLNQWELIAEQFALSFSSRLLLFLIAFILTDKYLHNIERYRHYTFEIGLFYVLVVCLVGGGYFPALIAAIISALAFDQVCRVVNREQLYWKEHIYLFGSLCIATFIYLYGTMDSVEQSIGQFNIANLILMYVQGLVMMLGVAFLGTSASTLGAMTLGTVTLFGATALVIVFFSKKMYYKTYTPIIMLVYFGGTAGLICLGRNNLYGMNFAFSSRYVCETNIALLGCFWIICLLLVEEVAFLCASHCWAKTTIYMVLGITMLTGIVSADFREMNIAPYRGEYYRNLISMMTNLDSLTEEDFLLFQADEDEVRSGVAIMREYHLGYFFKNPQPKYLKCGDTN